MPRLPTLSGREVVRAFETFGWVVARRRGSHMVLVKENHMATLSVPDHREVAQGTLRSLIRSAGLTASEFLSVQNQR
ncbi:MAG TPA: type II toxin-antitoxin system HicA family toxin [Thermoanaerobaculia bacterium]|nr:type II toxin-antitoxin system HicA family toxin [Thermoanaerobaculia bacterium]